MALAKCIRLLWSMVTALLLFLLLWFLFVAATAAVQASAPVGQGPVPKALGSAANLFAAPNGSGTACSQAAPCALQAALDKARNGDTVYLAAGSYTSNDPVVARVSYSITLLGGWDGQPSGPVGWGWIPSVLDGQRQRRVLSIGPLLTVGLEGLTLANGAASDYGAGIYAMPGGRLSLRQVEVLSNTVDSRGVANTYGGGLYAAGAELNIDNTGFQWNNAWCAGCPDTLGGGLYFSGSLTVTVKNSVFWYNTAWSGSGLCLQAAGGRYPALVSGCIFYWNGLGTGGPWGGGSGSGVALRQATAVLEGNELRWNRAINAGGALSLGGSRATLNRNVIRANSAQSGAAINAVQSGITLTNNIIADNRPARGGAIEVNNGKAFLFHNTLASNTAADPSCAILLPGAGTSLSGTNNIIVRHTTAISVNAYNEADLNATLWGAGEWANVHDWAGGGDIHIGPRNVRADPRFVSVDTNSRRRDYHLAGGSPAIDAGLDAGVYLDYDGQRRPQGRGFDIGADEWGGSWLPLVLRQ